jgi:hypothetical protein
VISLIIISLATPSSYRKGFCRLQISGSH